MQFFKNFINNEDYFQIMAIVIDGKGIVDSNELNKQLMKYSNILLEKIDKDLGKEYILDMLNIIEEHTIYDVGKFSNLAKLIKSDNIEDFKRAIIVEINEIEKDLNNDLMNLDPTLIEPYKLVLKLLKKIFNFYN